MLAYLILASCLGKKCRFISTEQVHLQTLRHGLTPEMWQMWLGTTKQSSHGGGLRDCIVVQHKFMSK